MDEIKKTALTQCLCQLAEKMARTEVLAFLIEKKVLTFVNFEEIEAKDTPYLKNFCLVQMLTKAGRDAFDIFVEALKKSNQDHLAKSIIAALESLRINEAEIGQGCSLSMKIADTLAPIDYDTLNRAEKALKNLYKTSFRKVNPFSLPYTVDIENTWVSIALRKNWEKCEYENQENEHNEGSLSAEETSRFGEEEDEDEDYEYFDERKIMNHFQLIEEAFENGNQFLVIEGRAASGKTSLMRRIAYDWAVGKFENYKFVFYVEFRNIQKEEFPTVSSMIQSGFQHIKEAYIDSLIRLIESNKLCDNSGILVLLDGFDEAQVKVPCTELCNFLQQRGGLRKPLLFNIIVSTRPGPLSTHMNRHDILNSATVLGFDEYEQKSAYVRAHFHGVTNGKKKIDEVEKCLQDSPSLDEIAETPLFLVFICLVYDKIQKNTVFELYRCIIWWLLDRYQTDHAELNVPSLFGFDISNCDDEYWRIIQDHFLAFPMLQRLGTMAFELYDRNIFTRDDLVKYNFDDVIQKVGLLAREENYAGLRMETQYVFPHRTIQEFLAGGIYFFWPESNAVNETLAKQIFAKDINEEKDKDMNELEKFMWRAAFSDDDALLRLSTTFQKYETLSLDLKFIGSLLTSSTQLNHILSTCYKVRSTRLFGDFFILTDLIDLSAMTFLQTLVFDALTIQNLSSEGSDLRTARCLSLPKYKMIKDIGISRLHFLNAESFIATVRYFIENISPEATIFFHSVKIYFSDDEEREIEYISASETCLPPLSVLTAGHDAHISIVLQCLSYSEEISICALNIEHVDFDKRFPLFLKLKEISLANFSFSKPFLPWCKMKILDTLAFSSCKFEIPALEAIICDICIHCKNLATIRLKAHFFESEDYFKKILQAINGCGSINSLWISDPKFGWESENDQTVMFNATAIFCEVVRHLQCLEQLNLIMYKTSKISVIVDSEQVYEAAVPRNNFRWTFMVNDNDV